MFYLIGRNREILRWVFIISMLFVRLSVAFRSGYVRNRYRSLHSLSISDTSNSGFHTAISFYKFVTIDDDRVDRIVSEAKQKLSQLPVKGTLLVAKEGYNGQFVVPKQLLQDSFLKTLESVDPLFSDLEINIGETIDYNQQQIPFPFKRLLVKRKKEIITAGFGEDLNWEDSGREVDPEEWHTALAADSAPIVLGRSY